MRNRLDSHLICCVVLGLMCSWAGHARSELSDQDAHPPSEMTTQENGFQPEPADHNLEARPELTEQENLSPAERTDESLRSQPAAHKAGFFKRVDFGVAGWFSQGQTVWSQNASNLDPNLGDPTSRLTYKDVGTNVLELNGKLEFNNRIFVRGNFGFSDIGGGRLTDDDYLSAQGAAAFNAGVSGAHRFSRTFSDLGGNNATDMWYVVGDLGLMTHEFQNSKGFVNLFVGFQYWWEKQVGRGVRQVECTTTALCNPPNTTGFNGDPVITNRLQWYSARLGSDVEYQIFPRVSVDAKLVFLLSRMYNEDVHNVRTDLAQNPSFKMSGAGVGTTADVSVKVMLLQGLYLSGGYRVWFNSVLWDKDWTIYGANGTSATAPLNEFYTLRYGPTVSLSYVF